eukprot:UN02511
MEQRLIATVFIVAIGSYTLATVINPQKKKTKHRATKSIIGNYTKRFRGEDKSEYDSIVKSLIKEDFAAFTLKDDYQNTKKIPI